MLLVCFFLCRTLTLPTSSARKADLKVLRLISTAMTSGALSNARNESLHRRARNTTRHATAMRKAHEGREADEEKEQLAKELQEAKTSQREAAARVKELQAKKTAQGAGSKRSRAAGDSSCGRVKSSASSIVLLIAHSRADKSSEPQARSSQAFMSEPAPVLRPPVRDAHTNN